MPPFLVRLPSRLSWKLLAAILPVIVLAVSGIVWLQYSLARRELLNSIHTEMGLLAQRTAGRIDELLDQRTRDVMTLAETPLIADYYRNVEFGLGDEAESYRRELEKYLERFAARSGAYAQILYLDARGKRVCAAGPEADADAAYRGAAAHFPEAARVARGRTWTSGTETLPGAGPVVYFAESVRDELGALKGELVLCYDLAQVRALLRDSAVGARGRAYVRMADGRVLEGAAAPPSGAELLAAESASRQRPWTVVVEGPLDDFTAPLRSMKDYALGTSLFGLALLVSVLLLMVRLLTRPIAALAAAARRIGEGDLSQRIADPGTDELGTLSGAFNEMADGLERNRRDNAALQAQLIQAEKLSAVGQLISAVAHELNNPLSAISGYVQLAQADAQPGPLRDDLQSVYMNVLRCRKVVDNLLFFVRQSRHERRRLSLNEAADSALELLEYRLIKTEDVRVRKDLAADVPAVAGDYQQVVQILVNVISNACDAMSEVSRCPDGKVLTVRTRAVEGRARVEIEDNGPGIPPETGERIFEAFYTTKEAGHGTGLGLSICRQIARDHGGDVSYRSAPGRGTTFFLDLPAAAPGDFDDDAGAATPPPREAVPGKRVLVADDEHDIAQLIARVLREDGDEAVVVHNGTDALALLKAGGFDLVVTDVEMEGAKGTELHAALIGEDGRLRAPILFVTGDILNPKVLRFLSSNKAEYLVKPFDVHELRQTVRRLLA